MKIVVDAEGGMLGRVAGFVAKQALQGKEVAVVNCNKALISGNKEMIFEKYERARARGGSAQKGPYFPKSPERIMKRTIRGMLPHKNERGRTALKGIMCYNTVPKEYESVEKIQMKRTVKVKAIELKKVSEKL